MKPAQETNVTPSGELLAASLELSKGSWKIALHDGRRDKPALHTVASEQASKRLADAAAIIEATKTKWGLSERARVVVVFEAGQDGFWIERALTALGYEVLIVDPASIPVARRARRAKTDRLDAIMLVSCLLAWLRGERDRMHVIHVPSVDAEAQRHLARDRGELQKEIGQHRDRIRKLLRTVGCWDSAEGKFAERLAQDAVRCHDGQPLSKTLLLVETSEGILHSSNWLWSWRMSLKNFFPSSLEILESGVTFVQSPSALPM